MDKEEVKKSLLEYIKVIIITVVLTLGVLYFIQISRVIGSSMEPTYHNGNIILVDKFFYKRGVPEYNDIVVIKYHVSAGEDQIIKRVMGLPGDHLEMKNNQLYRNGELLEEEYINETMTGNEDFSYDIPEGKIFVMGDNRNNSIDSRMIGYIDFDDQVVGRVFFKVF
ncbi:signal peptidase I [Candidatus Stoquefichus sp. SB1]|jgi:signal peptidase I|uniref:signal peptidase I n=1 Tax=Candidatus Stoquefichus sp. SB1 TaxID=1658109 RepID=UPI00067F00E6|nr:signal peptidase I [Candidatus Stoquefichus sp. SB1]